MSSACRLLLIALLSLPGLAGAGEVRVAVAANFVPTLRQLADEFTASTGHRVTISSASTGKLYAQIVNGAGFDLFLSADAERPERLEREGYGIAGERFVYALGRLALWLPQHHAVEDPGDIMLSPAVRRIAIANPRLAPYGLAARQVLQAWGLWDEVQSRLVRGENIAQTLQFVASGNAQAGFVALSQLRAMSDPPAGVQLTLPASLHEPIAQHAILLRRGEAAEALAAYLRGERARELIVAAGYDMPGGD